MKDRDKIWNTYPTVVSTFYLYLSTLFLFIIQFLDVYCRSVENFLIVLFTNHPISTVAIPFEILRDYIIWAEDEECL
jgi:hypothetical protein